MAGFESSCLLVTAFIWPDRFGENFNVTSTLLMSFRVEFKLRFQWAHLLVIFFEETINSDGLWPVLKIVSKNGHKVNGKLRSLALMATEIAFIFKLFLCAM